MPAIAHRRRQRPQPGHPVCPVISPAGLHVLIVGGPKLGDLRRDGRYAMHSETFPPPREEDGFSVSGRATEVTNPATHPLGRPLSRGAHHLESIQLDGEADPA